MPAARPAPVPLVLDTDIGTDVDDAIALAFAALDRRIDLEAVTTVNGPVELRAAIAQALLAEAGAGDVPVGAGRVLGLTGEPHATMPLRWGHEGRGIALAPPATWPRAGTALALLSDVLEAASAPVVVVCIGALTNVADLLLHRSALVDRIARIVLMGGALGPIRLVDGGDERPPWAETNLGCDPVAAAVVLASPVPLEVVPVDVTMPIAFSNADRRAIATAAGSATGAAAGPSLGATLGRLMDEWIGALAHHRPDLAPDQRLVRLHDPLAVVAAIEPSIGDWQDVRILLRGGPGRVETVRDPAGRQVRACRAVDQQRLRALLVDTLGSRANGEVTNRER